MIKISSKLASGSVSVRLSMGVIAMIGGGCAWSGIMIRICIVKIAVRSGGADGVVCMGALVFAFRRRGCIYIYIYVSVSDMERRLGRRLRRSFAMCLVYLYDIGNIYSVNAFCTE